MLTPGSPRLDAPVSTRTLDTSPQQRVSPAWNLRQGNARLECTVWSHWGGWELRLVSGSDLVRRQVVRSHEELVEVAMDWRKGFLQNGWSNA